MWANQFDNTANRDAHIHTTAPEIWEQTGGKIDGFVSAVGTGGTLAGTAIALRARNPKVQIALADPFGAAELAQRKGARDGRPHMIDVAFIGDQEDDIVA